MFVWTEEVEGHGIFENRVVLCTISISVIGIIEKFLNYHIIALAYSKQLHSANSVTLCPTHNCFSG